MRGRGSLVAGAFAALLFTALAIPPPAGAQDDSKPVDRIYSHAQIDVQKALDAMNAFATDRLPTLDGFVKANANTLDHFENPHYQLHIDVESQGISQTLVSVSAKITAWYVSDDAGHSEYVAIPSNGRLENDFLDRLTIYLAKGGGAPFPGGAPVGDLPGGGSGGAAASPGKSPPPSPSAGVGGAAGTGAPPLVKSSDPAVLGSEIATIRSQREAVEAEERKTQEKIAELTDVSKNQKFLSTIAVVRTSQTPVFADADETSKVLFHADPDDEFEMTDGRNGFVHVKLENGAMGWIQIDRLRRSTDEDDADAAGNSNFTTANEEIKTFDGDWPTLKGKPTLFVFAEPSRKMTEGTLGQSQLQFAKQVFVDGYREANHTDEPAAGVVVVFLGEKGGVAAASLSDIRRWRDGFLTDKAFLERCSLDPPDSFRDTPKP